MRTLLSTFLLTGPLDGSSAASARARETSPHHWQSLNFNFDFSGSQSFSVDAAPVRNSRAHRWTWLAASPPA